MDTWWSGKNKANSKPIKANQSQFKANTNPNKPNFRGKKSGWGANDRIEQSAIPHNSVSSICRLTIQIIGSTLL
ncbi:MAG: hypothetical protein ACYS32_10460 [Planctomycetota bacterium]